jgi:hypothetical protein
MHCESLLANEPAKDTGNRRSERARRPATVPTAPDTVSVAGVRGIT